ncbi:MAG: HAMP domain-containing histidine kinase [Oscillospiraceae bacterium]|nr:HAMP domain-containing histidine kinase [Oscillospiraceae bacterium]
MIGKLRVKFVVINMLIVTCMLALSFGLLSHFMRRSMVDERVSAMQRIAEEPMHMHSPGRGGDGDLRLPYFTLEEGPDDEIMRFGSADYDLSDEQMLEDLIDAARENGDKTGVLEDFGLRYYRAQGPWGAKYVFSETANERTTMRNLYKVCAAVGAASFVGFFVISLLLSKWAVAPVEEAWKQQKQFIADASHELKTPLTVIMANAELLQQEGYSDAQRSRFSESILTISQQMRHLLERLLDLARLDNAHGKPHFDTLDFSALAEDCLLPFEPIFFERGLTLSSEVDPGLCVRGDAQQLRQTVDILLDNARKYSADGGAVSVTLRQQGHHALLTVSNPAPEISRADRKNIFKRFYRQDEARTRTGSYGLGLPIAESIVNQHGGKIWCDWADGLISFSVILPTEGTQKTD